VTLVQSHGWRDPEAGNQERNVGGEGEREARIWLGRNAACVLLECWTVQWRRTPWLARIDDRRC